MSYRPSWWVPRATIEPRQLEASFAAARAQLPTTEVKLEAGSEGALRVFFSIQGVSEPSCWASLDLQQGTVESGRAEVTSFEAFQRELPPLETDDPDEEAFSTPWVRALAGHPHWSRVLIGGDGPWLVSFGGGTSLAHVQLMPWDAWRDRVERAPRPANEWLHEDPGIRRIRLEPDLRVVCGAPSVLFADAARGEFTEVATGIPDGLVFVDAVPFRDEWWVMTYTGDVWRSRAGTAERMLAGLDVNSAPLEARLDVRRLGDSLVFAQGLTDLSLWDGEALRPGKVPAPRNAANADGVLEWLATPNKAELWAAGGSRLIVGDGRQWFEPELPSAHLAIHGLCAEPSGGVWAVARDLARKKEVLLRATVARGVEVVEGVEFVDPEDGTPLFLTDPSPHAGGLLAIAGTQFLTWRPPSVGTSLSLRLLWEGDGDFSPFLTIAGRPVRIDPPAALYAAIDTLVDSLGGWFEG